MSVIGILGKHIYGHSCSVFNWVGRFKKKLISLCCVWWSHPLKSLLTSGILNLFKHLQCVKILKSKDYLAFIKWDDYWVGNLLFRSKLLNLKSNHERITLVAIYKRAPVPESLSFSLKKSGVSDLVMIWANCSKKTSDCAKKSYILYIFDSFTDFPFFMPKSELLPSLFAHCSFVKSNGSDLLS